ncbi:hypothetical protein STRAU_3465 [Streptomyces aurantiacus JA 4570]|uniref:Uncharacterized protein n=1 Tax=Streptomyces aurantiacus JA 4570 TaxID=1286094 RepID=S3ZYH4_9ACTN|nr:hypothetical protein STRAU_3465 [Streptomyces aurantiacus JA 4570]
MERLYPGFPRPSRGTWASASRNPSVRGPGNLPSTPGSELAEKTPSSLRAARDATMEVIRGRRQGASRRQKEPLR